MKNVDLSLTDVITLLSTSRGKRRNLLYKIVNRESYDPKTDTYMPIKSAIKSYHKQNHQSDFLYGKVENASDTRKPHYNRVVANYMKWLSNKKVTPINTDSGNYTFRNINIKIQPDLGLNINGNNHFIKIHFKKNPAAWRAIDSVIFLMNTHIVHTDDVTMSFLDLAQIRLISRKVNQNIRLLFEQEFSHINDLIIRM